MASSRRLSNGRSPLVNQQSQITSFFSKSSASPASSSPVVSKHKPELNPNPSPSTPSTPETKQKKPLLVIGHSPNNHIPTPNLDDVKTPDSGKATYNEEVVGKRIKVYWPLDKSWHGGFVKSFDSLSGRHMVQYDDAEEEVLDLGKEKIEWVEEAEISFRRLRRLSASKKAVLDDGEQMEEGDGLVFDDNEGIEEGMGDDDDSADEDWGKNVGKDKLEDESEEMDLEDEEQDGLESLRQSRGRNVESKKRKTLEVEKQGSGKKSKSCRAGEKNVVKDSLVGSEGGLVEPPNNAEKGKLSNILYDTLKGDAAERFGLREAEKLWFLQDGHRDAERRRPGDADYDPRTLFLPHDFLKSLSGGQRQWWEFKSKHMDKVLFFKMGKFYELFEMDAHVGAKELNLQYMKGEQPHCGFPERNFSMNVEKLARKGYRVLVVEQTETPEQLEVRRKQKGSKDKVVKREICAVVTKGTLTEGEIFLANPDASYLMAVTENCCTLADHEKDLVFGVCVVDVSTSRFMLGQFEDDLERNVLCCLLSELRPVEIIKPAKLLSPETERTLLRHTRNPLFNDLVPLSEFWNADRTVREIQSMYKRIRDQSGIGNPDSYVEVNDSGCLPDILNELVSAGENGSFALSALGGSLFYLRQAFLDETLLRFAKFEILPCSGLRDTPKRPYMVLDAAALENLEIFENSRDGSSTGTLYGQLNHCVTAFGKRLLKKWLARPLCHLGSIRERQDAVASLRGANLPFALEFRKEISRLPDMERLLARLFATSSEANGRNANKVILYEDAAKKQLQEFISALRGCELIAQASCSLQALLDNTDSSLLQYLLSPGKGFPEIHSILEDFKGAFDWIEADHSGRIIPREGVDKEYDSACKVVKNIEIGLTKYLKEQRKLLNDASINYVTVGKELYLLEVPESFRAKVPRDYELRSSKKGFFRYWTPHIKELLGELSQAESEKESKLKSILQRLIGRFCEHHIKWRQMVSATAELDVLISLAIVSDYYEGPTCRPIISDLSNSSELPHFSAKSLGHPILRSDALGKGSFVPNDVTIGGSGKGSLILLTGPNMGGKSTLLRQVCMSVILAQLGADVPAERFELSLVDRIFVRMGAKDHIMAGQSTFLTELSETASMLSLATCNSLVALDELGRGTSTSDGQAIAESVVEHFVRKVQCRGIFSTHYHRLAVGYQKDSKVSLCHMACQVGEGVGGLEEVTFLYRLTPGACPKSYGVNVARLAGLPDSLLQKAAAKSREFETVYGKKRKGYEIECYNQCWDDEMVVFIQEIVHAATNSNFHGNSNGMGIGLLVELQHRAKLLLQEGK